MSEQSDDTVTYTIEGPTGETDALHLPDGLIELFMEDDETAEEALGDLAMLSAAQQIHAAVHHSQGGPSEELEAIEDQTMDQFEQRFGVSYAEMTGHDH
ncbi:MAG: hypothetical protein SVG88_11970 [Halobacteriales archaeon]|nr:hypothetical protein [Halobacteriales archaeon]